ncbi:thioester reductase domain-containing protein [Streptomyces guryensis]|uniref:Thioester reductase domain-containing protein n=1 Tax=Streptomyces guryensis TaxID=2886947 RepID=A0A9Q3VTN5_9ACTN|nr:thioester reductase domain-containing protein [Streptomyces guryensis]MCD9879813.1 thioester reductase domain-containing protein [Streptomyces guryensis]
MREMNEDTSVDAGRRATAESIECGGGGLSVSDLLAKVMPASVPAPSAAAADGPPDTDLPAPAPPSPDIDALAAVIAAAAGRHLPEGHLSPDTDFFDAGGSSVNAVELVAELEEELGIEVDLDEVFADARPSSLARRWARIPGIRAVTTTATAVGRPAARTPTALPVPSPGTPPRPAARFPERAHAPHTTARREDLDQILADLALADHLPFVAAPEALPPRRILLTGATGFLGSHMLLDLLRHSDAQVYCLVRAADEEAAEIRLGEALRGYRLPWSSEVRRRITVLPGDIRSPRLGLSEELWNRLAHELDGIVGVAAAVDFLRGYQSLRASNVLGTLALAELAAAGRPKPLHHISSIAVFNEVGITSMGEDDPLAHADRLIAGYDQTKWAAEVALRRARDHGLIVTALRPGGIGGHTRTGAYNPQDLSSGLVSAFGRFRTVPAFRHLNVAPVDWVSRVAVGIVCEPDAWGYDYNLTGVPNTLDDVVQDMALGGMHVCVKDWDDWRTDTLACLQAEPIPELAFLSRVLQSPTALKLCEATLKGPAATGERTAHLVEALGLPPATRYDARAQLKTFERLAGDGLARLPHKDDQPYLWFTETTEGHVGPVKGTADTPCSTTLTLSIASMHQLVTERRIDVRGQLACPAAHPGPLTVERGDVWIRPEEGIPERHGLTHQLLRYRLLLRDTDGGTWWLEGRKHARARRDVWRQTRALSVEIGREGEPASLTGELVVPADSYVRDQIDGIKVDPRLTGREQRAAKLTWLAWFGLQMGRGLLGPFTRAAADLLDLRRTQNPTEHSR